MPDYNTSLANVQQAVGTGPYVAYKFDANNPIPAAYNDGTRTTLKQDGELYVFNNASHTLKTTPQLRAGLLNDTHAGVPDSRCESTGVVASNGTPQTSETYQPRAAWEKLGKPKIAFNTNYFDVMPQTDKTGKATTWQASNCSSPQGVYYDNHPATATQNRTTTYQPGTSYWVDGKGNNPQTTDTFFVVDGNENGRDFNSFELVRNDAGTNSANAENRATELRGMKEQFSAFSGTDLSRTQGADPQSQPPGPDSGSSKTTRISLNYDQGNDRLYVFRGGSYRDGVSRKDLSAISTALGATQSIELDGGGSAGVVVDKNAFAWTGAQTTAPAGSCPSPTDGGVCSPITQPDGSARAVPGWIGLSR